MPDVDLVSAFFFFQNQFIKINWGPVSSIHQLFLQVHEQQDTGEVDVLTKGTSFWSICK